jgi:dUTPase
MSERAPVITYESLYPDVPIPARATRQAAGYDVCAYLIARSVRVSDGLTVRERACDEEHRLHLGPGEIALVPLGFKARLPDGYEAQVRIRSSIAFKRAHYPERAGNDRRGLSRRVDGDAQERLGECCGDRTWGANRAGDHRALCGDGVGSRIGEREHQSNRRNREHRLNCRSPVSANPLTPRC